MSEGDGEDDKALREALVALQREIKARVELERERDSLTTLGNLVAIRRSFDDAMAMKRKIWGAFLEVDSFKSINDQFGYEAADALLKHIGAKLKELSTVFFGQATAYRAHGDEFYLLGICDDLNPAQVHQLGLLIEQARQAIADVRVDGHAGLQCTVSVGWTTSDSYVDELLDCRGFLRQLEDAVAAAKARGRNCVVRFESALAKAPTFTLRAHCLDCTAKFSFDVDHNTNRQREHARCPNCGAEVQRPPAPQAQSVAPPGAIELAPIDLSKQS